MSRQALAAQCFRALLCRDFERIRRSKSLLCPLCPLAHFVVWVSVWVKNRIPVVSDEDAVFSKSDDCCDGSLNRPNCQAWTASLEPISPLLQGVQESHEKLMAGKCVLFIAGDTVERSNSIRITEPNRITALFHSDPFLFNRPDSIG